MKKVLVVGAGMGGLSAAIRLQKEGFQVEIYEQQHMLGVRCIKYIRMVLPLM